MTNEFLGFMRPDGHAGARNTLLILPINRSLNFIATNVCRMIRGAVHFEIPAETGRPAKDRETIARVMEGLIRNPNVGGTLLLAVKPSGESAYRNMSDSRFAAAAEQSGKPFRILYLTESGGSYGLLGKALQAARSLAVEVSRARRSPCPLSALTLAVKCGTSDATSGIAGNPTVGNAFDRLIDAGGTAMFSETTEIIGAEKLVAARAVNDTVAGKILTATRRWEEKALSTGEDIRAINPIPANIAAGISTLEEKSLGAIAKSGHRPIQDVLTYGEAPSGHGLYFMDAWMSSLSLPLGFTAAGAAIMIYQMGGNAMPENPPMPAINPTVVSPFLYVTGNARAFERSPDNFDFDASPVMSGNASIEEMGEALLTHLRDIASGTVTKMETLLYEEQLEVFMEGPVL